MKLFFIMFCIFLIYFMFFLRVRSSRGMVFGLSRTVVCVILSVIYSLIVVGLVTIIKIPYTDPTKIFLIWFIIIFAIGFLFGKVWIDNCEIYGLSRLIWIFFISIILAFLLTGITLVIFSALNIDLSQIIIPYTDPTKIFLICFIIIFAIEFFFGKIGINNYEICDLSRLLRVFLISIILAFILTGITIIILSSLNIDLSQIIIP